MANPNPKTDQLKPFAKGYDPRRNLRGTPKDAIEGRKMLRKLAAELVHIEEPVYNPETGKYEKVEYDVTRLYTTLRLMFTSKAPKDRETLLKALYPGLLKDEVDVTSGGEKIKGYIGINPAEWDKDTDEQK